MNSMIFGSFLNLIRSNRYWCIAAYLNDLQAKVNAFPLAAKRLGDDERELQSQSQEELDASLPSVLDRAFRGQL